MVIYQQALKLYCTMSLEERAEIPTLDSRPDALLICTVIKHHGDQRLRVQRYRRELKNTKKQLAKIRASRTHKLTRSVRRLFAFGKPRRDKE